MTDFLKNSSLGLFHVLDINALDHLLFLVILIIPYRFKSWKKAIITISFFTIAHTISLFLAVYDKVQVSSTLVEILIPITIIATALLTLLNNKNKPEKSTYFTAFFFGLIHGLGFSGGFRMIFGRTTNKTPLLLEFALGIELAQIILIYLY